MNEHSSRSHTIFRVVVESRPLCQNSGDTSMLDASVFSSGTIVAELNLVDLAGSERVSLTGADGMRLREGAAINKSLLALSSVISKLSEGKHGAHIPYRDSKLTRILQNSLGGNTRTIIICNITPAAMFADETISTLKFASRAKQILNTAVVNEILSDAVLVQRYRQEILHLQEVNCRLLALKESADDTEAANLEKNDTVKEIMAERDHLLLEKDQMEKNFTSLKEYATDMEQKLDIQGAELELLRQALEKNVSSSSTSTRASLEGVVALPAPISVPIISEEELAHLKGTLDTLQQKYLEKENELVAVRAQLDCSLERLNVAEEKVRDLLETQAFREDECTAIVQDAEQRLARMVTPSRLHAKESEVTYTIYMYVYIYIYKQKTKISFFLS